MRCTTDPSPDTGPPGPDDRSGHDRGGNGARLAPRGVRLLARFVDGVTFAFAMALVYVEVIHRFVGGSSTSLADALQAAAWTVRITFVAATFAYELVPTALWGRTFGKALLGLRVEPIAQPGRPPGFARAFVRWLVTAAILTVPYVGLLGYLVVVGWVLVDPRRQGLHDKLAGTVVVDAGIGRAVEPS
jgi:uncharacterized RDD family membrane protein YckC